MKKLSVLAILLSSCLASVAGAQEPSDSVAAGETPSSWNLSHDLLETANQISFNQGSRGVWYFMESSTPAHDVLTYKFLPEFRSPCRSYPDPDKASRPGVSCWIEPQLDVMGNFLPLVALNATDVTQRFPDPFDIPPRSVYLHPGLDRLAIVAWKSPVNGRVTLAGSFSDLDPRCGNGVLWSIDKGSTTLRSGDLPNGAAGTFHVRVGVERGDVLYFIVDPQGEYSCDTTGLDVTITRSNR